MSYIAAGTFPSCCFVFPQFRQRTATYHPELELQSFEAFDSMHPTGRHRPHLSIGNIKQWRNSQSRNDSKTRLSSTHAHLLLPASFEASTSSGVAASRALHCRSPAAAKEARNPRSLPQASSAGLHDLRKHDDPANIASAGGDAFPTKAAACGAETRSSPAITMTAA